MIKKVSIVSMASISPLGMDENDIWKSYQLEQHNFKERSFGNFKALVSDIRNKDWDHIESLRELTNYKDLDPSVLLAIAVARKAVKGTNWQDAEFGINIGSSRGATNLFEKYHEEFINNSKVKVATLSSPTTTLGNISSWVGHDLQANGPTISHSIACSTSLHAILNGIAWINSGMTDRFLAGGSEASNTAFTIAQMKALKIYANNNSDFPCRTLDLHKNKNTMILGEAAAVFCLEKGIQQNALALIEGIGYATEPLKHNVSISTNANCFQKSMKMALKESCLQDIDVIVMHSPGTIKGDLSEFNAIKKVFGNKIPAMTSNKWKFGHTLGASGGMSLQMAIMMMHKNQFIPIPFLKDQKFPIKIKKVLVNAVGFGGNAVSILITID